MPPTSTRPAIPCPPGAVTDSSPLIRRLEAEQEGRSVLPQAPALAFLNSLIEDYADEWLTKAMFHYRWSYAADIDKAGNTLPAWRGHRLLAADPPPGGRARGPQRASAGPRARLPQQPDRGLCRRVADQGDVPLSLVLCRRHRQGRQ